MRPSFVLIASLFSFLAGPASAEKELLWGDTHLHTSNSFDAYLNTNTTTDPDSAYRFAKGEPVVYPVTGVRVQLETPLDFLVVADHGEYYGVIRHVVDRGIPLRGDEDDRAEPRRWRSTWAVKPSRIVFIQRKHCLPMPPSDIVGAPDV